MDIGTVLDGYKLLAPIASGSCGTVWQAENILSGTLVALKIIPLSGDLAARELQAIRLYQKIDHPNLIRVHHVGFCENGFFYTMDWCECSLAQRKVSPEELPEIARKLAAALAALHAHGLIHRDIKPDNLLFRNGEVVLGDIGLVTRRESATFAGSPGFLPPSVATGGSGPDEYSDCYALAKSLYCVLSGLPPEKFPYYDGTLCESASLLMRAILAVCSEPPEIREAADFLKFLEEPAAFPARRRAVRRKFRRFALSGLLLLLFGGAAWGLFRLRSGRSEAPAREDVAPVISAAETAPVREEAAPLIPAAEPEPEPEPAEIKSLRREIENLREAAGKCSDPEEEFQLRMKAEIGELIIDWKRRYGNRFFLFEEDLEGIRDSADMMGCGDPVARTVERGLMASGFYRDFAEELKISDPELQTRMSQAKAEWETRRKSCALQFLREIRETGNSPETVLEAMAAEDPVLRFFGVTCPQTFVRYRDAWLKGPDSVAIDGMLHRDTPKDSTELMKSRKPLFDEITAEYLKSRDEFLRAFVPKE